MKPFRVARSAMPSGQHAQRMTAAASCAKPADLSKPRSLWASEELSTSPASVLPSYQPAPSPHHNQQQQCGPPGDMFAPSHRHDSFEALTDAGRLLGRVLDSLAGAVAGRHSAVPSHVEALLARLFPCASSISATLPSSDGQGIAVTTLLHPATAAAVASDGSSGPEQEEIEDEAAATAAEQQQQHQHTEPLGRGMCSFQLAAPPTGDSLRLMKALMQQLDERLRLEAAEGAAALTARLGGVQLSSGRVSKATSARPAAAPAPSEALALAPAGGFSGGAAPAMPADCFWMSM